MPHPPPSEELSQLTGLPREFFSDVVFQQYSQRLAELARQRLGRALRPKVSPEDIVQSAFRSFYRRIELFHFDRAEGDSLWGLLVVITLRKCAKWHARFHSEKRALHREVDCSAEAIGSGVYWGPLDREPSPEEAAVSAELIEQLLEQFDARRRQMILLRLQGYELNEIALAVKSSRRTVARAVAELKEFARTLLQMD